MASKKHDVDAHHLKWARLAFTVRCNGLRPMWVQPVDIPKNVWTTSKMLAPMVEIEVTAAKSWNWDASIKIAFQTSSLMCLLVSHTWMQIQPTSLVEQWQMTRTIWLRSWQHHEDWNYKMQIIVIMLTRYHCRQMKERTLAEPSYASRMYLAWKNWLRRRSIVPIMGGK